MRNPCTAAPKQARPMNRWIQRAVATIPLLVLVLAFNSRGSANVSATAPVYSNTTSMTIPTSGTASLYPSTINVSGVTGTVTKVTVTLTGLSHTFPDDIDILLVGPAGQSVVLMSDTGGSPDVVSVNLTFDDGAPSALPDTAQIVSGTFKPTNIGNGDAFPAPAPAGPYGGTLAVFNGVDPNGSWRLFVVDDVGGDLGSLSGGWSLAFTLSSATPTPTPTPTTPPSSGGLTVTGDALPVIIPVNAQPLTFTFVVANNTAGTLSRMNAQIALPAGIAVQGVGFALNGVPLAANAVSGPNCTGPTVSRLSCVLGTLDASQQMTVVVSAVRQSAPPSAQLCASMLASGAGSSGPLYANGTSCARQMSG